jgi:hypothetical protein
VYQFATILQLVEALRQVKRRDNEWRLIDRQGSRPALMVTHSFAESVSVVTQ